VVKNCIPAKPSTHSLLLWRFTDRGDKRCFDSDSVDFYYAAMQGGSTFVHYNFSTFGRVTVPAAILLIGINGRFLGLRA
jgi:hypothetical protein